MLHCHTYKMEYCIESVVQEYHVYQKVFACFFWEPCLHKSYVLIGHTIYYVSACCLVFTEDQCTNV